MRIEILTFAGCPNRDVAYDRVRSALRSEGVRADVLRIDVETPEEARETRFLGSPSIRIDGSDVEPGAGERIEYGLMCRTYSSAHAMVGAPPIEMIRAAIRAHLGGASSR